MRNKMFTKVLIVGIFALFVATSIAPSIVATETPYTGHLHVYVVEPVSRWKDYNGEPYHFGFLDFAFNDDISIDPQDTLEQSITWNGDVTETNIMVIAVVSNSEQHQEYACPPNENPFVAYYTDATAAATPGNTGYNMVNTEFTHTVFVEEGTGTWCPNCPAMAEALYTLYESGEYPFYFVAMIGDKNSAAASRLENDYNIQAYPTAFFDGGYQVQYGSNNAALYCREKIEACGKRIVPTLSLSVSVTDIGNGDLHIAIAITNDNEGSGNRPPTADAGGPYYASVGDAITFDGSRSSDTEGLIEGYRWDFTDDGTYDTEWLISATTTHSYLTAGTYTVNLQVKDNDGAYDTDTATITITSEGGNIPTSDVNGIYGDLDKDTTSATISELVPVKMPPVANAGGPYLGVVGSEITFDGSGSSDSDGSIISYSWYFDSGPTGKGVHTTHTYTTPGNYTVTLIVMDNDSLRHSNETTVRIISGPPKIVISINASDIETIEEENEMTIPITVSCYNQSVSNIHLEILDSSNLTITASSSNISLNRGKSEELLIKIIAPKLENNDNSEDKVCNETITLWAVGDSNVTSNTEQINIEVVEKGKTPGFEILLGLVLCAIALVFLWKRKRK